MYNVTRKEGRALPLKKVKSKQHVSKGHKGKFFNRKRREKISSGLFIAPSFLGVLIFFLVPFMIQDIMRSPQNITLAYMFSIMMVPIICAILCLVSLFMTENRLTNTLP